LDRDLATTIGAAVLDHPLLVTRTGPRQGS
jgi:hypothetical protein